MVAVAGAVSENDLIKRILMALSERGHRAFRNNTGMGWAGHAQQWLDGSVLVRYARPLRAGLCEGSSDIIGWTADGKFLAIEVKCGRAPVTPAQRAFLRAVHEAGGRAGIAYTVEDAIQIAKREKTW